MSKPSLTQVATEAGVSLSTANDAFDEDRRQRLAPETVAKVHRAASALGYVRRKYVLSGPMYAFMNPRPQQAPDQMIEMWLKDYQAQQLAAMRAGAWVVGFTHDPDNDPVEVDGQLLDNEVYALYVMWRKKFINGFILTDGRPYGRDRRHEWLLANNVPFVQHGRGEPGAPYCWIELDDAAAVSGLTNLLVDAGHIRVAHLGFHDDGTGPPLHRRHAWTEVVTRRLGYDQKTLDTMNCEVEFLENENTFNQTARNFIEQSRPTAVVCDSDTFALQLQRVLHSMNLLDRIEVTGMDNDSARRAAIEPFASATVDWVSFGDKTIAFLEHAIRSSRRRGQSSGDARTPGLNELHPWELVDTDLIKGPSTRS